MEPVALQDNSIILAQLLQTRFGWSADEVAHCQVEILEGGACWVVRTGLFRKRDGKRVWISQALPEGSYIFIDPQSPRSLRRYFRSWDKRITRRDGTLEPSPIEDWLEVNYETNTHAWIVGMNAMELEISMKMFRHLKYIRVRS